MTRQQGCVGSAGGPTQSAQPNPAGYRIFLLTVWRDDGMAEGGGALRFSLDDPRSGQRRGFGEPEGLLAFLAACLDAGDDGNPGGPDESNS
jgi:hypothetical protein